MESLLRTFLVGNLKINSHTPGVLIETVRITVYMDIQNYIHKDGLFSIKSHTCTFLPSVVTGIISLHCLNDNNEKKCFFCLFVCFGGGKTFTQPSCRLYSCSWFEAIVANRKCGREVCLFFYFNFLFALCLSLSNVAITRDVEHRLFLLFSGGLDQTWWSVIIFSHHHSLSLIIFFEVLWFPEQSPQHAGIV